MRALVLNGVAVDLVGEVTKNPWGLYGNNFFYLNILRFLSKFHAKHFIDEVNSILGFKKIREFLLTYNFFLLNTLQPTKVKYTLEHFR